MAYFEHYARGKKCAKEAVSHDQSHRYSEALKRYVEAASELLQSSRHDFDTRRRDACKAAAARYINRAEILKQYLLRNVPDKASRENPAQQSPSNPKDEKPKAEDKQQHQPASKNEDAETLKIPTSAIGTRSSPDALASSSKRPARAANDTKSPGTSHSGSPFVRPLTQTPRGNVAGSSISDRLDASSRTLSDEQAKKKEKIMALLHQLKPHLRPGETSRAGPANPIPNTDLRSLPPNWRMHTDPTSGRPYYHNELTNVTTWDRPRSPETSQSPPPYASPPAYTSPLYTSPTYSTPAYSPPSYTQTAEGAQSQDNPRRGAKPQFQNRAQRAVGARGSQSGGKSGGIERKKGSSSMRTSPRSAGSIGLRARRQLMATHGQGEQFKPRGSHAAPASAETCLRVRVHYGRQKAVLNLAAGHPLRMVTSGFAAPVSGNGASGVAGSPPSAEPWTVFCSSRGFLSLSDSLTPALQVWSPRKEGNASAGATGDASDDSGILLGLVPSGIQREQEQRACQTLATIATEAGKLLHGAYGLVRRGDNKSSLGATVGTPKDRKHAYRVTQEKITRLLLRLDTVDTSEWTRPLRKMQVQQLLAASKDIGAAAKACGLGS